MKTQDFTFDVEKHEYNGGHIPACTKVLHHSGLVDFRFVDADLLERKSELGREVHKACHLFNQEKQFTCDNKVYGYLESWKKFCRMMRLQVILSEFQQIAYINGMQFGMQIDIQAEVLACDTIIDLKIGQVYSHHGIQLAGYAAGLHHARFETPFMRFRTRKRMVVQLDEEGKIPKVHRFEDKSDFDVFASALYVTYWKMGHKKEYQGEKP